MSAARPPEGANWSPSGGVGAHIRAARPPEGALDSPHGRPKAGRQLPTTALRGRGKALPTQWARLRVAR